jgi:hypothetical protein
MRIFYDVKKRRMIIRLAIAVISLFSFIMIIKSYFMPPTTPPSSSATGNVKQTENVIPVQSTGSKPVDTKNSNNLPNTTPTSIKIDKENQVLITATLSPSAVLSTSIVTKTATQTSAKVSTPTPPKPIKPTTKVIKPPTTKKAATPVPNTAAISGDLHITYFNSNTTSSSNTINPMFKLINKTNTDITLSDIKIRYYFTVDSNVKQSFWCDWSSAGTSNVFGRFIKLTMAKSNADHCLEIGFANASGVIATGETVEIQTRFSKDNWTDYSQSNDYSFNPSKDYTNSNKITVHLNEKLIYGKEP